QAPRVVEALRRERMREGILVGRHGASLLQRGGDFNSRRNDIRSAALNVVETRMAAPTLTLYGESFWISPYVFSCFVALREKRLPFTVTEISLAAQEQREPGYRDRAFTGKVPALVHGDFWLTESSAIIEYLEEVFPAPSHPAVLPS